MLENQDYVNIEENLENFFYLFEICTVKSSNTET